MFRLSTGQKTLFDTDMVLAPDKLERLKNSWAGVFQEHALPLLFELEPRFARYYHQTMGAPSKPGALMLGLLLLKESFDLTDMESIERLDYDLSWHFALGVSCDTYVCPKTLYNFRKHIERNADAREIFKSMVDRLMSNWSIKTTHHRLDSTHIVSNMSLLTRLQLFVKTIEAFVHRLERKMAPLAQKLPKRFHESYLQRRGYFCDARSSEAPRRLRQCAKDLWYLIDCFCGHGEIAAWKSYKLMVRLFRDQCVVCEHGKDDGGEAIVVPGQLSDSWCEGGDNECEVELKPDSEVSSDSLQSSSDADATFSGHKGKGYQAQLGETCEASNVFQVIDYVKVEGAHESDQNAATPFHEELLSRGHDPKTSYVDSAYVSGENIVKSRQLGVELKGPMSGKAPGRLNLGQFRFTDDRAQMIACPAGHAPMYHEKSKTQGATNAWFAHAHCDGCSFAPRCLVRRVGRGRFVSFRASEVAIGQRRCEQETQAFKEEYKIRSGIEASNSQLKNKRGMGRLRVRGAPSVQLVTIFKVLGENIFRMVKHVRDLRKATKTCLEKAVLSLQSAIWACYSHITRFRFS